MKDTKTDLVVPQESSLPERTQPTAAELIQAAITQGLDPDGLTKLVELHERVEAKRAAQEFAAALAAFQKDCPTVVKNKTAGSGSYTYDYADLPYIVSTVRPHLIRHGLSFSFDQEFADKQITVTTTIRHTGGHAERSSFRAPYDAGGKMNDIQKVGSATTYAKRYGLLDALGIMTGETDDDGNAAGMESITDSQVATIEALVTEIGLSGRKRERFLKMFGVDQVGHIKRRDYQTAVRALEGLRGA